MLCAVLAALGLPAEAHAYRTAADLPEFAGTPRVVWRSRSVGYVLRTPPPGELFSSDIRQGITSAAAALAEPACANVRLVDLGPVVAPATARDGLFTIEVVSDWAGRGLDASAEGRSDTGPEVAATTDLRYLQDEQGWFIAEADIYLRGERLVGVSDVAGEVRRIMLHEFAHVLGGLHPCGAEAGLACTAEDALSVLAPARPALGGPEELSADDVAGLCFLYPRDLCTPACGPGQGCVEGRCLPAACAADAECPSSACVAGACASLAPELGDPCAANTECASRLCAPSGVCTRACGLGCEESFRCDQGFCLVDGLGYGDECVRASQCHSGLCLTGTAAGARCTRPCSASARCPGGDACQQVAGREVCVPPAEAGAGCALAGPPQRSPPALLLLFAALSLQLFRRRRRSRGSPHSSRF